MQFIDGAIETWTLDYDDFTFIAEQQKPSQLDIAIKLLSLDLSWFSSELTTHLCCLAFEGNGRHSA